MIKEKASTSFFEKKKQKNFCSLRALATAVPAPARTKSFLVLFFKKEQLFFLPFTA